MSDRIPPKPPFLTAVAGSQKKKDVLPVVENCLKSS